jgi:hypothetical protein
MKRSKSSVIEEETRLPETMQIEFPSSKILDSSLDIPGFISQDQYAYIKISPTEVVPCVVMRLEPLGFFMAVIVWNSELYDPEVEISYGSGKQELSQTLNQEFKNWLYQNGLDPSITRYSNGSFDFQEFWEPEDDDDYIPTAGNLNYIIIPYENLMQLDKIKMVGNRPLTIIDVDSHPYLTRFGYFDATTPTSYYYDIFNNPYLSGKNCKVFEKDDIESRLKKQRGGKNIKKIYKKNTKKKNTKKKNTKKKITKKKNNRKKN